MAEISTKRLTQSIAIENKRRKTKTANTRDTDFEMSNQRRETTTKTHFIMKSVFLRLITFSGCSSPSTMETLAETLALPLARA